MSRITENVHTEFLYTTLQNLWQKSIHHWAPTPLPLNTGVSSAFDPAPSQTVPAMI